MCASLQSGTRLCFAPRLQEAFVLKCAPRFYQHWSSPLLHQASCWCKIDNSATEWKFWFFFPQVPYRLGAINHWKQDQGINENRYWVLVLKISDVEVHTTTGAVTNGAVSATTVFWYCRSLPTVYITCSYILSEENTTWYAQLCQLNMCIN